MWKRIVLLAVAALVSLNASAQFATLKESANGVTITVTPGNLSADSKVWDFAVVLDTHSQDLSDDLVKAAVLLDGKGNELKPLAWEGAGPGGHHRKGVLKFEAPVPRPQTVELRINRQGETKARSFRWALN